MSPEARELLGRISHECPLLDLNLPTEALQELIAEGMAIREGVRGRKSPRGHRHTYYYIIPTLRGDMEWLKMSDANDPQS